MRPEPGRFDAMTFDCYGTLIDWERGILAALGGLLGAHGVHLPDDELLAAFARHETALEAGPYLPYRAILAGVAAAISREQGVEPDPGELDAFAASVADWPAFDDSPSALASLASRFRLGVITNCDDDLFAASSRRLGVTFDVVVTSQQVGSYKPDHRNFEVMLERLGIARERILHVAQSLYHDHVPAKALGLSSVWVDRRGRGAGPGATPRADASPDLVVPDMATLSQMVLEAEAD